MPSWRDHDRQQPEPEAEVRRIGAWLRAQREKRLWTREETARQLVKAAGNRGIQHVPDVVSLVSCLYRWEKGTVSVTDRYRMLFCDVLGIPADLFGAEEPSPPPPVTITLTITG